MDFQATVDDPLQTALATAFTDSPILAARPPSTHTTVSQSFDPEPAQEQVEESGGDDSWKDEYEQHLSHWRAESAVAREKAEQERERWKLIREQEQKQKAEQERVQENQSAVQRKDSEWETVTRSSSIREATESAPKRAEGLSAAPVHNTATPHTASSQRDLVTGGTTRGHGRDQIEVWNFLIFKPHRASHTLLAPTSQSLLLPVASCEPQSTEYTISQQNPVTVPAPHSNTDDHGLSSSRTWEEVPSDDSSFPSLSFPERSVPASPDLRGRPLYRQPPAPPSITLAIFDSSLSCRARTLALISSIGINLVLPFINGVMLGFGEIFAKNVVGFFGWNTSTAVGLRAASRKR